MKLFVFLLAVAGLELGATEPVRLQQRGTIRDLVVDGKPFLIRGGEVNNSHGEPEYLRPYWRRFKDLNLNTVLVPVYWESVEPKESEFNWSSVDGLVADAREHGLRLILLWFGTWKNSTSSHVPAWVKTDSKRFLRARDSADRPLDILSPFGVASREADARAFAEFLKHLRAVDETHRTVLMVQVENEVGMIPEARDHCGEASQAFAAPVPLTLLEYMQIHESSLAPELRELWITNGKRTGGTWTEVFGDGLLTSDVFMAWAYGSYIEEVARRGREEYSIPLFVNAALIRPGYQPGQYPSGGPLPHLIDVWRAACPAIEILAPDIYFQNFTEWASRYTRSGNTLFIPEAVRSSDAVANCLFAFGSCDAIGFSPFGIDDVQERNAPLLRGCYDLVEQLTPLILTSRGTLRMAALVPPASYQKKPHELQLGGLTLSVTYEANPISEISDNVFYTTEQYPRADRVSPTAAVAISAGPDEFVIGGIGLSVKFSVPARANEQIGILSCEEGRFVDGKWRHLRWLNGDQTDQGRLIRLDAGKFTIQRVRLYRY